MGKIYEALEKAQRERQGGEKAPHVRRPCPRGTAFDRFRGCRGTGDGHPFAEHRRPPAGYPQENDPVHRLPGGGRHLHRRPGLRHGLRGRVREIGPSPGCRSPEPQSAPLFRLQPKFGWEEILRNRRTFKKAICRIGDTKLHVYPIPPGSASLPKALFSPEIKEFWDEAKEKFDLILIDSAPASASPDGIALSRFMDGVVLVLEADKTRKPVAENLKTGSSRTAEISSGWCSTTADTTFPRPSTRDCEHVEVYLPNMGKNMPRMPLEMDTCRIAPFTTI